MLSDEFVVELVETLSSEMNPDTVCTVAGLCNNQRIDDMLEQYYAEAGLFSFYKIKRLSENLPVEAQQPFFMIFFIKMFLPPIQEQFSMLSCHFYGFWDFQINGL